MPAKTSTGRPAPARAICTPAHPYAPDPAHRGLRGTIHPYAICLGGQPATCDTALSYHCPICGLDFRVTLPN